MVLLRWLFLGGVSRGFLSFGPCVPKILIQKTEVPETPLLWLHGLPDDRRRFGHFVRNLAVFLFALIGGFMVVNAPPYLVNVQQKKLQLPDPVGCSFFFVLLFDLYQFTTEGLAM